MQAHAAAVVAEVAIDVAVAAGLAALGIGVAGTVSNGDYSTFINKMKTTAVTQAAQSITATMAAGRVIYNLTTGFLTALGNQFMSWYSSIPSQVGPIGNGSTYPVGSLEDIQQIFHLTNVPRFVSTVGHNNLSCSAISIASSYSPIIGDNYYNISNNIRLEIYHYYPDSPTNSYVVQIHQDTDSFSLSIPNSALLFYVIHFINSNTIGLVYQDGTGKSICADSKLVDTAWDGGIGNDVIDGSKVFSDGVSILNNPVGDVVERVGDTVGTKNDAGEVVGVPVNVNDGADTSTDKTRDVSQEKVLGKDIATDADRDADKTTNTSKDTTAPKSSTFPDITIPEMVTKKFPFSLPWDLYNSVVTLASPGEAPVWTFPFDVNVLNVHSGIKIDMSQYNTLAAIVRWGLSLLFLIGLIILTNHLIKH